MAEQHFLYSGLTDRIVQIVQGRARQVTRIYRVGTNILLAQPLFCTLISVALWVSQSLGKIMLCSWDSEITLAIDGSWRRRAFDGMPPICQGGHQEVSRW